MGKVGTSIWPFQKSHDSYQNILQGHTVWMNRMDTKAYFTILEMSSNLKSTHQDAASCAYDCGMSERERRWPEKAGEKGNSVEETHHKGLRDSKADVMSSGAVAVHGADKQAKGRLLARQQRLRAACSSGSSSAHQAENLPNIACKKTRTVIKHAMAYAASAKCAKMQ